MTHDAKGEMPFLDHLEELRYRLLWSLGTLVVTVSAAFAFVMKYDVIGYLSAPIQPYLPSGKLIITHPADGFAIALKVAFGMGIIAALPMILYHLWAFLSPALHRHEKKIVLPVIFSATALFGVGVYLAVMFVLPKSFDVLLNFQSAALENMISAREYFGFAIAMSLACGAVFQLPIVIGALTALGIVTPRGLGRFRRHAMIASFVAGAIITPGDLLLMTLLLGGPIYALYEVSIVVSWVITRSKARRVGEAAAMLLVALAVSGSITGFGDQARLEAQAPGKPTRVPGDTGATRADTTQAKTLVTWTPDDSVVIALLERQGYRVVRFQASRVGFDAKSRVMRLSGNDSARAAVQRDSTLLVARTIAYDDSAKTVEAKGDTIVMRDPARGEDLIGHEEMRYDLERRSGTTRTLRTLATAGETWSVEGHRAAFESDSASDRSTVWVRDGTITSCLDSVPHYHFRARALKRVSGSIVVARPAILYIQGVPVMWLPFIFQDIREGRRSGIITPRIGFTELVRNSPTYRRTVEDLGYYFALSDYWDAQVSMDWRSSARATLEDPGWTRLNTNVNYRWLNRFISGSIAASRTSQSNGAKNLALSWSHNQEFSTRTRFTTNLNYVTSTQVQRSTSINPYAAIATIASAANLVRQQGPFTVNLGGTRRQYPGRDQVDESYPSLNVASKPLALGDWFVLNPSLTFASQRSLNIDGAGEFAQRYSNTGGALDSVRLKRDTRSMSLSMATPFKVFYFQVNSGFRFNEAENDFPEVRKFRDPADTSRRILRVYEKTFKSEADFDVSIGLPQFLQGTLNVAPSIAATNVDPRGFLVRTERTAGRWVAQSKRLSYGLGISPTLFRLYPGFGRVERIRHAIQPTLSWSYSPAAEIDQEFLDAFGTEQSGYLGTLAQNRMSLGLSTNIEAKVRGGSDTTGAGAKVKVLSVQFTSLSYDFERKRATGRSGFATDRWGYTLRSDLLPGFDFGVDYSLFQGNVLSDTAEFSPYRESIRGSFSVDQNSRIVRAFGRLLGADVRGVRASGERSSADVAGGGLVSGGGDQSGFGATTGTRQRVAVQEIPTGQGFSAAFTFSSQRQRPPKGDVLIIENDPERICAGILHPLVYAECIERQRRAPSTDGLPVSTTEGGAFHRNPPLTSIGMRTSFNLTQKWAASWSTSYDVEEGEFAQQVVTLQRELHDWRAIFGFTQAQNGNFAFTFLISLKAQPEIKLDYDRQTYRQPTGTRPP